MYTPTGSDIADANPSIIQEQESGLNWDIHPHPHDRLRQLAIRTKHWLRRVAMSIKRSSRRRSMAASPEDQVKHCMIQVTSLFPDISPTYLKGIVNEHDSSVDDVVNFIVDQAEQGHEYEKKPVQPLKRKREEEDSNLIPEANDEMTRLKQKYDNPARRETQKPCSLLQTVAVLIAHDFPFVPVVIIRDLLKKHGNLLLPTYLALEKIVAEWGQSPVKPLNITFEPHDVPHLTEAHDRHLKQRIARCRAGQAQLKDCLEEALAARQIRESRDRERLMAGVHAQSSPAMGHEQDLTECQCCFMDCPMVHMVHCSEGLHLFCTQCARLNAETSIGQSRYELKCMSTDKCHGTFTQEERKKFLDRKLKQALDRIEAQNMLRLANLENLEQCSACDYAAEYPPVAENRVFECLNPDCLKKTCRLCRQESHIPRTCKEVADERGDNARKNVEEAMTEALVRRCIKCKLPFVKLQGCNRMSCPVPGCGSTQCYVCSQPCTYDHFKGPSSNTLSKCPLYDNEHTNRHREEVNEAEKMARQKVIQEHPDIDPARLDFNLSERVKKDERIQIKVPQLPRVAPQLPPLQRAPAAIAAAAVVRQHQGMRIRAPTQVPRAAGQAPPAAGQAQAHLQIPAPPVGPLPRAAPLEAKIQNIISRNLTHEAIVLELQGDPQGPLIMRAMRQSGILPGGLLNRYQNPARDHPNQFMPRPTLPPVQQLPTMIHNTATGIGTQIHGQLPHIEGVDHMRREQERARARRMAEDAARFRDMEEWPARLAEMEARHRQHAALMGQQLLNPQGLPQERQGIITRAARLQAPNTMPQTPNFHLHQNPGPVQPPQPKTLPPQQAHANPDARGSTQPAGDIPDASAQGSPNWRSRKFPRLKLKFGGKPA